ncbi:conserved hypothetical protein [Ixodes scapularis]|uniref:Uncharacterized protein n=1 Tax=Ixodes scapularis TaxID=6945 RepID=B7PA27_IXOSC|nr:conserved hypothetical protein [Ixodes scapularis]|eukprot:XP_002406117.1 conserved hypothetical protein [Ixodes scapularis]
MTPPTPPPLPEAPLEAPAPSPPPAMSASLSGVDEQEEARRNLLLKESKEKLQSLLDKKLQYWDKLTVAKADEDKLEAIRNIMNLNKDEIELAGKVGPKDKLVDVMDTKLKLATETLDQINAEIQKDAKEKLKQLEKWEAGAIMNLKNLNRLESELAMRLSKRRSKNQDDQEDDLSHFGDRDREGDLDKNRDRDSDRERDRSISKERRKKSDAIDREAEEKKTKGAGEKELKEQTKKGTSEKEAEEAKDDAKLRVQHVGVVELDARADTQMCDENLLKLHELEFRIANDMLKGKYKGKKGRDLTSKEMKEKLRRLCDLEVQIADELFGQDPDASASLELDAIITKPSAMQVTAGKEYDREQRRRSSRDSDEREGRDRDYGDRRDYLDRRDFYERRDFSPIDRMDYPDIMEFPDYPERMVYADQYGGARMDYNARIDYPVRMNYPPQADYRRGNMQIPPGMLQMQAMPQIPQMAPPIEMEEPGNELVRHHENIEVSGDSTVQVIKHTAHSELIRSPSSDPRSLDVPPKRYISEDSLDTNRKPIVATFEQVADDQTTLVKLKTAIDIEIIPQGGKPASLDKGDTRGSVRGGVDDVESEVHIRNKKSREILNVAVTSSSLPMGPSSVAPAEPTPRPAARTSPFYWTSSRRTPLAEDEDYDAYGEEDSVSMNRRGQDLADRRVAMDDEIPPGPSFWQWICQSIYSPRRGRAMAERPERSLERGRSRSRDQERDDRVREKEEELRQLIDSVIKVSQDVIMARRAIELGGVGEERCLGNMLEAEGKLRDLIDLEVRLANELSNFRNSDMVPNEESRMSVLNAEEKIRRLIDVESRLAEGFVTERKSLSSLPHNTEGAVRAFEVLATQQHTQSLQPRDARRRPASRREPSSRRSRDEDLDDGGSPRRRPSWSRLADRSRGNGDDDDRRRGDRSLSRPRARDVSPTRRDRAVQRGRRDWAELDDDEERQRRSSSRRRRPSDDNDQDDRRETIYRGLPPDDVDDDERLRRRGSKKRADDDDELPARHRASRLVQGEEEDEAPRMLSRKKQVDDVEERTPRRGASKSRKDDDDELADDDEEDEDEAVPRRGRPRARRARTGSKGRGAKVTAQKQVIKVTEGVPVKISLSGKVSTRLRFFRDRSHKQS